MWIQVDNWKEIGTVSQLICLAFLTGISIYDIWFRKIITSVLAAGGLLTVAYAVVQQEKPWYLLAAGGAVGLLFLAAARLTREAVGYGDGCLITILGVYLGLWDLLAVLATAWFFLAVAAGICLVGKKWSRKAALPMTPFLTAGFGALLLSRCFL